MKKYQFLYSATLSKSFGIYTQAMSLDLLKYTKFSGFIQYLKFLLIKSFEIY
jgi:hypothetical protein